MTDANGAAPAGNPKGYRTPPHPGESPRGESLLSRRDFIRRSVQLAVGGAALVGVLSQVLPSVAPASLSGASSGPVIRRDERTNTKIPITLADLAGPTPVVLTAEWNFLPAVIYKVKKASLEASSRQRGINTAQYAVQHPDEPDNAIMVYQGKCKHLGCTVGFNAALGGSKDVEDYDGDGINDGRILCPCHQGQYDIYDLATNVPGTPPPAPLNVIRFSVADFAEDVDRAIPAAAQAIVGAELIEQNKPHDADQDPSKSFALGTQAAQV